MGRNLGVGCVFLFLLSGWSGRSLRVDEGDRFTSPASRPRLLRPWSVLDHRRRLLLVLYVVMHSRCQYDGQLERIPKLMRTGLTLCAHDVVHTQQQLGRLYKQMSRSAWRAQIPWRVTTIPTHLDGSLQGLDLDGGRLQQTVLPHVDDLAGLAIYTKVVLAICVLGL